MNGRGTYDKILANLIAAAAYFERLRVRVNVDTQSVDDLRDVISQLEPIKSKIWIGFLPVQTGHLTWQISANYQEFKKKVAGLNDLARSRGFRVSPGYKLSGAPYCGAYSNNNYFLIDARCDIHKCSAATGRSSHRAGYLDGEGHAIWNPEYAACHFPCGSSFEFARRTYCDKTKCDMRSPRSGSAFAAI